MDERIEARQDFGEPVLMDREASVMRKRILLSLLGVVTGALLVMNLGIVATADAQTNANVEYISGYLDESVAPFLVADQDRTVHAVTSQNIESGSISVMYRTWTQESGWTDPVDVVLAPDGHRVSVLMGLELDQNGLLHTVFYAAGSSSVAPGIYYTQVQISLASDAKAWMEPLLVGPSTRNLPAAAFERLEDGTLMVLYSSTVQAAPVLVPVRSTDEGRNWIEADPIIFFKEEAHQPFSVQLKKSEQGGVHATWTVVGEKGNGEAVQYSRWDQQADAWSTAVALAERKPEQYEADWLTVVEHQGELIAIYNDRQPATRWMRKSLDMGSTWSEPERLFSQVGEYGHARVVQDGAGKLHMILGNRTTEGIHGIWSSQYESGSWSSLEPIVSGPRRIGTRLELFDPTQPQIVMSQGNTLLVTWVTDSGIGSNGVWSSVLQVDAPELPVRSNPTPNASSDGVLEQAETKAESATAAPSKTYSNPASAQLEVDSSDFISGSRRSLPYLLGLVLSVSSVGMALIFRRSRNAQSRRGRR